MPDRAIVIGAGVSGLTTAIALSRAGLDVTVFEQNRELREIGAGLGVQYAAMKALRRIGMEDQTREIGQPLTKHEWTTWNGKPLVTIDHAPIKEKIGAQTVNVHRGEFLSLLVSEFGRDRIELGAKFSHVEEDESGVTVQFEDGRTERAAVLVGADGARSPVRAYSVGDGAPRRTNMVVWRAMPSFEHPLVPLGVLRQAYGPGKLFSMVPGTKGRVFWFGVGLVSEFGEKPPPNKKDELRRAFAGWAEPVGAILAATDEAEVSRTAIFDRKPAQQWSTARVTLAGDAAHPIMPTLGQGASTGIEDGVVLAKYLSRAGSLAGTEAVRRALQAYESDRIARTSPLVNNAHRYAWIALANNPVTQRLRNLVLSVTPASSWQRRLLAQHSYEP